MSRARFFPRRGSKAVRNPFRAALSAFLGLLLAFSPAFAGEIPRFSTLEEAMAYLALCEREQRPEVLFLVPTAALLAPRPILDDRGQIGVFDLEDSLWNLIYALPSVFTLSWGAAENGEDTCVRLGLVYRDGARLYRAFLSGTPLAGEDRQALKTALALAEEAGREEGDMEKAAALCALLCARIRFAAPEDSPCNVKSCLAALNRGMANCQGYSDAFYLAASLLGLKAGYVNGQVLASGENHTFNTLEIDGRLYYTDLTWMDRPEGPDASQLALTPEALLATRQPYPFP